MVFDVNKEYFHILHWNSKFVGNLLVLICLIYKVCLKLKPTGISGDISLEGFKSNAAKLRDATSTSDHICSNIGFI